MTDSKDRTRQRPALWHRVTGQRDGMDVLREVAIALERGHVVPEPAAGQMLEGIRAYVAGAGDLDSCLGLRARHGRPYEHPRRRAAYNARDELIKQLIKKRGGTVSDSSQWLSDVLRGRGAAPQPVAPLIRQLKAVEHVRLDLSARQIIRIVQGHVTYQR